MKLCKSFTVLVALVLLLIACNNAIKPTDPAVTTVVIQPREAKILVGDSLQFTVSVNGTGDFDSSVVWQVNRINGGNTTYGTIDLEGLYVAPHDTLPDSSVLVYAVSAADHNKLDSAFVTILGDTVSDDTTVTPLIISVTVSPSDIEITVSDNIQFEVVVEGIGEFNTAVTWYVNDTVGGDVVYGTITGSGFYAAPDAVPADSFATVEAVSVADSTKHGSAVILINEKDPEWTIDSVIVFPQDTTVRVSQGVQFTAWVMGTGNFDLSITWSVNNVVGGTYNYGWINSDGFYTAPDVVPLNHRMVVRAVSVADSTRLDSAIVNVYSIESVDLSPGAARLLIGESVQFTASITGAGSFNHDVTWFVNGTESGSIDYGTITSVGLYTAPLLVPSEFQTAVKAVATADTSKYDSVIVELFSIDSVTVSPLLDNILIQHEQQFTAMVFGTGNFATGVIWSADFGHITGSGMYTAPDTLPYSNVWNTETESYDPEVITVSATSVDDQQKIGLVSFVASSGIIGLGINPTAIVLSLSDTTLFTPVFYGSPVDTTVRWFVGDYMGWNYYEGGNEELGTIDENGLYVAPSTAPNGNAVFVVVRSVADMMKSGNARIFF